MGLAVVVPSAGPATKMSGAVDTVVPLSTTVVPRTAETRDAEAAEIVVSVPTVGVILY